MSHRVVTFVSAEVLEEFQGLPADVRARFQRIFTKKTHSTPRREIQIALNRAKEIKP